MSYLDDQWYTYSLIHRLNLTFSSPYSLVPKVIHIEPVQRHSVTIASKKSKRTRQCKSDLRIHNISYLNSVHTSSPSYIFRIKLHHQIDCLSLHYFPISFWIICTLLDCRAVPDLASVRPPRSLQITSPSHPMLPPYYRSICSFQNMSWFLTHSYF